MENSWPKDTFGVGYLLWYFIVMAETIKVLFLQFGLSLGALDLQC